MMYASHSCENLSRIHDYDMRGVGGTPVQQAYFSEWPIVNPHHRRVMYKPKKSKGMFKRKRSNEHYHGGFYER